MLRRAVLLAPLLTLADDVVIPSRFTARVDLRGFPRGRFTVRIRIRTVSERTLDGRPRDRTCAPRGR